MSFPTLHPGLTKPRRYDGEYRATLWQQLLGTRCASRVVMAHRAPPQLPIDLPPIRPNSVSKIGSDAAPFLQELWLPKTWLSKTIWFSLFCLIGLGPVIAIKVAAPSASSLAEPAQNESGPTPSKTELALAPNETAKSDRLELLRARPEPEIIVPGAMPAPAETPPPSAETSSTNAATASTGVTTSATKVETASSTRVETAVKKAAGRPWQNANARLLPTAPPHRHIQSKEPKPTVSNPPPSERAEAWHCRQDAMGSILRSLDLSPRCNL
jgi:hypothetical protein